MTIPTPPSSHHMSSQNTGQERIAIFMPSLDAGGGERVALTLARAFSERGHTVELIVTDTSGPYRSHIPENVKLVELIPSTRSRAYWQIMRNEWRTLFTTLPPLLLPAPRFKRLMPYLPALGEYLERTPIHSLLVFNTYSNILAIWAQRWVGRSIRIVLSERNAFSE